MNNAILALVSVCLVIVGSVVVWATRVDSIDEMVCERRGITINTTMTELRKPGPYVIGVQDDGDTIAIPKDGIRCQRLD